MNPDGKDVDTSVEPRLLFEAKPFPENFNMMYFFTNFTLQLNNLPEGLKEKLPPTDSRLRPDQRAVEEGDFDRAGAEKNRLEEK